MKKLRIAFVAIAVMMCTAGCSVFGFEFNIAGLGSAVNGIKGDLVGNAFECQFYDNYGERFLTVEGTKVGMCSNVIKESTITSAGDKSVEYGLSSVVTITVDCKEMESCGDTIIFQESGLSPDVDFVLEDIRSQTDGDLSDNTSIAGIVNRYKNFFGKGRVVVVQSQLGVPICAYSGDDVYWKVEENLPKTTKLMIDGKALYIHRANFQVIDSSLVNTSGVD